MWQALREERRLLPQRGIGEETRGAEWGEQGQPRTMAASDSLPLRHELSHVENPA